MAREIDQETRDLIAGIHSGLNVIATKLDAANALIKVSMTPAEVSEVKGMLTALRDRTNEIGADPVDPVPEPSPAFNAAFRR